MRVFAGVKRRPFDGPARAVRARRSNGGIDVRAPKAMLDAERDRGGGQQLVFAMRVQAERRPDGVSKVEAPNLVECRRNVPGRRARGLHRRQHRGRAMLVYSYYSDQIIVTTDERRSGPVDLPQEVGPSLSASPAHAPSGESSHS